MLKLLPKMPVVTAAIGCLISPARGDGIYRTSSDPGQGTDVSAQYPSITQRLIQVSNDWKSNVLARTGRAFGTRPFIVGNPGSPFTQLSARDGEAHGSIKRSNRWPNCSFFRTGLIQRTGSHGTVRSDRLAIMRLSCCIPVRRRMSDQRFC